MKQPPKPQCKIKELEKDARDFLFQLFRDYCKQGLYQDMHKKGIGLEETEESFIALYEAGYIKFFFTELNNEAIFTLKVWNFIKGEYEEPSMV